MFPSVHCGLARRNPRRCTTRCSGRSTGATLSSATTRTPANWCRNRDGNRSSFVYIEKVITVLLVYKAYIRLT